MSLPLIAAENINLLKTIRGKKQHMCAYSGLFFAKGGGGGRVTESGQSVLKTTQRNCFLQAIKYCYNSQSYIFNYLIQHFRPIGG